MLAKRMLLRGLVAVAVLGLAACASQVTRTEPADAAREPVRALSSFDVELSLESRARLAEDLKFDLAALRSTIRRALDTRNLIATDGDFEMKVVIDDVRVRSTFNAVMFGFMAGDDHLNGTALLRRGDTEVGSFGVKTSWALGGFAGGQDGARLSWLYEAFAKQLADELVARRDGKR